MAKLSALWQRIGDTAWSRRVFIAVAFVSMVAGLGLAAIYAKVVDKTETLAFCAHSCHEMNATVYAEYTHTAHFKNPQGVVVTCADCHIPNGNWLAAMGTKIAATTEIWGHLVGGESDLKIFNARRPELEKEVLAGFAAANARACKSCHVYANMILPDQNPAARAMHTQATKTDANCLECHQEVAHPRIEQASMAEPAQAPMQSQAAAREAIYDKSCAGCHTAMAPKLGDKAAWAPLIKEGEPALVDATIHGKGIMPTSRPPSNI